MKLNISTAVLAAGLLAAPLVYAHESAPATQGAGQKMGGHMMDQMNEMMKARERLDKMLFKQAQRYYSNFKDINSAF